MLVLFAGEIAVAALACKRAIIDIKDIIIICKRLVIHIDFFF